MNNTNTAEPTHFEFCFPSLDTQLLVEVADGEVTIRATRDTFSRRRKAMFVRQLVAEGFIPDEFRWFSPKEKESHGRGVRWLIDISWLAINKADVTRTRRFVLGLVGLASVLLVLLVGLAATGRIGNSGPDVVATQPHWMR
jgi:hypothetical protein